MCRWFNAIYQDLSIDIMEICQQSVYEVKCNGNTLQVFQQTGYHTRCEYVYIWEVVERANKMIFVLVQQAVQRYQFSYLFAQS